MTRTTVALVLKLEGNQMLARRRRNIRKASAFTLIELLVVVIIIGILAAIALPNFIGAQDKAREASVKANMSTAQIAAEAYATDNGGTYPTAVATPYESYYPGGGSDGVTAPANGPVNPFTNAPQWPASATVTNVQALRATGSGISTGSPGEIFYYVATPPTTYAITGCGKTGSTALGGSAPGTFLVLSNQ